VVELDSVIATAVQALETRAAGGSESAVLELDDALHVVERSMQASRIRALATGICPQMSIAGYLRWLEGTCLWLRLQGGSHLEHRSTTRANKMNLNPLSSLLAAVIVLLIGTLVNRRVSQLST
jgi:hypothetical protein